METRQDKSVDTVKLCSDIYCTPTHKTPHAQMSVHILTKHLKTLLFSLAFFWFSACFYKCSCLKRATLIFLLPCLLLCTMITVVYVLAHTCLCKAISLKFQHKLSADEKVVTFWALPDSNHRSSVQTRPNKALRTGYELGHSSRRCWELKLCHRRDGKKQGGSSILIAAGLVELRMALSHVDVLHLECLSTISCSLSRAQRCLAPAVGSMGVNQRSVFWSLSF